MYLFGEAVESAGPREKWAITAASFVETALIPCLPPFGRPRFERTVTAGFPSPADDHIEGKLDLNLHLIRPRHVRRREACRPLRIRCQGWIEQIAVLYRLNEARLEHYDPGLERQTPAFDAAQGRLKEALGGLFAEAEQELAGLPDQAREGKALPATVRVTLRRKWHPQTIRMSRRSRTDTGSGPRTLLLGRTTIRRERPLEGAFGSAPTALDEDDWIARFPDVVRREGSTLIRTPTY